MSLVGSAVLSASLAVQNGNQVFDNPEEAALQHLGRALYVELKIDDVVKRIEKRHVPENLKTYAPYVIVVTRIVTERQVSYRWTF